MNTGISVNESCNDDFKKLTNCELRWMKMVIKDEEVVTDATGEYTSDFDTDFKKIKETLKKGEGCYILLNMPKKEEGILFTWYVPSSARVKIKMLTSSTQKNVLQHFPSGSFCGIYRFQDEEDFDEFKYNKEDDYDNTIHESVKERMMKEESLETARYDSTSSSTGKSMAFPMEDGVTDAVKNIDNKNLAIFKVENEKIAIDKVTEHNGGLEKVLPQKEPRFVLYKFHHEHEGNELSSNVFIYSCPGSAKIKFKMIYSSTKAHVLNVFAKEGVTLSKSIESSDVSDLTESFLIDEIHPKKFEEKVKFNRVKVQRRRPKRVKL